MCGTVSRGCHKFSWHMSVRSSINEIVDKVARMNTVWSEAYYVDRLRVASEILQELYASILTLCRYDSPHLQAPGCHSNKAGQ